MSKDTFVDAVEDIGPDVGIDAGEDVSTPEDITFDTHEDTLHDTSVDVMPDTSLDVAQDIDEDGNSGTEPPFFQSGFEPDTEVVETGLAKCSGDILGEDTSVANQGHWVDHLEASPIDKAQVCYGGADDCALEGGQPCQRGIARVPDPDNADNWVLHTWIKEPAENFNNKDEDDIACSGANGLDTQGTRKSRIQLSLNTEDDKSLASFSYSVRIRLGDAYTHITKELNQAINWMTLGEFWSAGPKNVAMGDRSRVTLNLVQETPKSPFHFGLKADFQPDGGSGWAHIWKDGNGKGIELVSTQLVPIGEWFTLHAHLVAGTKETGRVTIEIENNKGETETLFDVSDATVFMEDGSLGFTAVQPIKIYTSGNLVCWLKSQTPPMILDAWWDDFVFNTKAIE